MTTPAQLRDAVRHAAAESLAILNDASKSAAQKKQLLAPLDEKITTAENELHIIEQRQKFTGMADAEKRAIHKDHSVGIVSPSSDIPAPPITITTDEAEQLYDAFSSRRPLAIDMKALATTDAPMTTVPDYRLPPLTYRREPLRVIDLLPVSPTDKGTVDFFRITTATNAASTVAEGGTKPTSSLVYEKVEAPIRKIAHVLTVNDEALQDYSQFLAVISEEMLAGLVLEENHQLVAGNGTAPDLTGMLNTSGILTQAKSSDTRLDAILKAITAIRNGSSYAEADGIVMHPTDYQSAFLEKDSTGKYLATDPVVGAPYQLWGLNVKVTTQIPQGTALVGAFRDGVQVFLRMAPRIEINPWAGTEFKANQTIIRCEERLGIAVTRPTTLCKVTGL